MHSLALVELQALVAALSLTGLFLGVMVDERERATESLKASLRLAAAGGWRAPSPTKSTSRLPH